MFDFKYIDSSITKVYVKLDDKNVGKEAISNNVHATKSYQFKGLMQIFLSVKTHLKVQFPLILVSACTIDKVQGLVPLNSTVVSSEFFK